MRTYRHRSVINRVRCHIRIQKPPTTPPTPSHPLHPASENQRTRKSKRKKSTPQPLISHHQHHDSLYSRAHHHRIHAHKRESLFGARARAAGRPPHPGLRVCMQRGSATLSRRRRRAAAGGKSGSRGPWREASSFTLRGSARNWGKMKLTEQTRIPTPGAALCSPRRRANTSLPSALLVVVGLNSLACASSVQRTPTGSPCAAAAARLLPHSELSLVRVCVCLCV